MPKRPKTGQNVLVRPDKDEVTVFTLQEVIRQFKLGRKAILRMVAKGQLQGLKLGGRWRFRKEAIEQALADALRVPPQKDVPPP